MSFAAGLSDKGMTVRLSLTQDTDPIPGVDDIESALVQAVTPAIWP